MNADVGGWHQVLGNEACDPADGRSSRRPLGRFVTLSMLSVLSVVVVLEVQLLWREWRDMRQEVESVDHPAPIGFHNVYTHPSRAIRPVNWFRPEGERLYLWAGWERTQHHWFMAGLGDFDRHRLSDPISRDVIRSVNDPWTEIGGGAVWERMPPEVEVVGESLASVPTAYPVPLMMVMHVVNDLIEGHPYLAFFCYSHPRQQTREHF